MLSLMENPSLIMNFRQNKEPNSRNQSINNKEKHPKDPRHNNFSKPMSQKNLFPIMGSYNPLSNIPATTPMLYFTKKEAGMSAGLALVPRE